MTCKKKKRLRAVASFIGSLPFGVGKNRLGNDPETASLPILATQNGREPLYINKK
jgi:hypothetical protein